MLICCGDILCLYSIRSHRMLISTIREIFKTAVQYQKLIQTTAKINSGVLK